MEHMIRPLFTRCRECRRWMFYCSDCAPSIICGCVENRVIHK